MYCLKVLSMTFCLDFFLYILKNLLYGFAFIVIHCDAIVLILNESLLYLMYKVEKCNTHTITCYW